MGQQQRSNNLDSTCLGGSCRLVWFAAGEKFKVGVAGQLLDRPRDVEGSDVFSDLCELVKS